MSFNYRGKEYGSKADAVRNLYDAGLIDMSANAKKDIAEKLGMTVQTVHATLKKYIGGSAINKTAKTNPKKTKKIAKISKPKKSRKHAIILSNKKDKSKYEGERILVTWAPNKWGLPVCNPPIEVIDDNYNPETDDIAVG